MSPPPHLQFKLANEPDEFDQIHQLNHRTFTGEIPQHPGNPTGRLVDRFHAENTYAICLDGRQLVGMVALRGRRPFSLDGKLPDLDSHLPAGRRICEIRLLAVEQPYRHSHVFPGLVLKVMEHFIREGFNLAIISGTVRQSRLYRHLGFVPFGPLVGTGEAVFQPMQLSLENFLSRTKLPPPAPGKPPSAQ